MHHPTDRITHTTAFVTPVVEHWMEREIAQWVHPMKDRSGDKIVKCYSILDRWISSCLNTGRYWVRISVPIIGQVMSESLMCTLEASCCSARLSRAQVPTYDGSFVRDRRKKGEGKEGRKERFYLTTHSTHFLFTVICRQTYGKEPFR